LGSADATQEHLLLLKDTGSLVDPVLFKSLSTSAAELSGGLFRLIRSIEQHYETPRYLKNLPLQAFESAWMNEESLGS
jgi:hypothetical protein